MLVVGGLVATCTVLLAGVQCVVIRRVELSKEVERGLRKLPQHVARKLLAWVRSVELVGLEEVRRIPGFHDEPLQGDRRGQRSIRLNRGWRAIYVVRAAGVEFVLVEEVSHHDY